MTIPKYPECGTATFMTEIWNDKMEDITGYPLKNNKETQVDFEMLKETINSFIKLLDKKLPWSDNLQLFFDLLSKNASFAHKAHKELQRLNK